MPSVTLSAEEVVLPLGMRIWNLVTAHIFESSWSNSDLHVADGQMDGPECIRDFATKIILEVMANRINRTLNNTGSE